jgi:hypothetical protein
MGNNPPAWRSYLGLQILKPLQTEPQRIYHPGCFHGGGAECLDLERENLIQLEDSRLRFKAS